MSAGSGQDGAVVRVSEARMENVGKRYGGVWAVRGANLSILPGEIYTLLGPPGSGKTTLLRLLAGFVRPDEGRILVDDEPVDAVPPERRNLGVVFPTGALWPHMSVFDNVALGLRARGLRGAALDARVKDALAHVGLEGAAAKAPAELAPGESQRAALARALAIRPRLLLLDEPLAGLDSALRTHLRQGILHLHGVFGTTTLHATADHAEALSIASRIGVISAGRIVQEGRPEEIYWSPKSAAAARSSGQINLVPVRVVELREAGVVVETAGGARLPVASGGHPWSIGARGLLSLRPEALTLEEAALSPGGLPGTIDGHVFEGSRQIYEVAIPGGIVTVEMRTSALVGRGFRPGDSVRIEISPETSVLLPDDGPAA